MCARAGASLTAGSHGEPHDRSRQPCPLDPPWGPPRWSVAAQGWGPVEQGELCLLGSLQCGPQCCRGRPRCEDQDESKGGGGGPHHGRLFRVGFQSTRELIHSGWRAGIRSSPHLDDSIRSGISVREGGLPQIRGRISSLGSPLLASAVCWLGPTCMSAHMVSCHSQ
jgi:hypothetical protein